VVVPVCSHGSILDELCTDQMLKDHETGAVALCITDRKYVFNVGVERGITPKTTVYFKSINVHEFEDIEKYHDTLFIVYIIHRDTV